MIEVGDDGRAKGPLAHIEGIWRRYGRFNITYYIVGNDLLSELGAKLDNGTYTGEIGAVLNGVSSGLISYIHTHRCKA